MNIPFYQVDAFTDEVFHGNPAAVCLLDAWLEDTVMQKIAMENNLSETAFIVKSKDVFQIRWFTPVAEVALCGHATLASAHVLFSHCGYSKNVIVFESKQSGVLRVQQEGEYLTLDFPAQKISLVKPPTKVIEGLGKEPIEVYKGNTDYMFVYHHEQDIQGLSPDFHSLSDHDIRGVIVTAKGDYVDFVSRFFAPKLGVNEDPVTGSSHTLLIPYWAQKLKKIELVAKQLSARQGVLRCRWQNERVFISGQAITYLQGTIIHV